MQSDFNSLIKQINNDLCNAEEMMNQGNLDQAFKLSEKIAENLHKVLNTKEQNPDLESLQISLAQFRRNLNNQMVKVVKAGFNNSTPNASLN